MNEAQTLINLEKFMSSVCRRDYHWEDFAPDYDQWLDDARAVYDDGLKYSPLIQAYFDLIPERIDWEGRDIFEDDQAFKSFQRRLKYQQQYFIEDSANRSDDYRYSLDDYFTSLVDRHRKLLLVRVDLSYRFEHSPRIQQFDKDIKKLISRIQNKDTIFKNQVGYAYRLEQGGQSKGYHCHLLVIYNDEGVLGLGMVERRNKTAIKNAYNTIHYLTRHKPDQYLRVKLNSRMRVFRTGQTKPKEQDD